MADEQVEKADELVDEAIAAGLVRSHPVTIHAKMLRLQVKADIERGSRTARARLLHVRSDCPVGWGLGVSAGLPRTCPSVSRQCYSFSEASVLGSPAGTVPATVVPIAGADRTVSAPPSAARRSVIPWSPVPPATSAGSKPLPSSDISNHSSPLDRPRRTVV